MKYNTTRLDIIIQTRSDNKFHSVNGICSNVTMYAACNSSDGRIEFDMMDVPKINCRFGDQITLSLDTELIFQGKLFSITRTSDIYVRHYIFYDESFYLRNSITYPVPTETKMLDLVQGLLNKYEIYYSRLDANDENVSERKIQNISILDAITEISNYVSYMYNKMYVLRQNKGSVEFIDIESANVHGFKDSYPLVIDFSDSENISEQTYNYFEFYKRDDNKKETELDKKGTTTTKKPRLDGTNQNDTKELNDLGKKANGKPTAPESGTKTSKGKTEVKYRTPIVPYEQQKINLEIAMYAVCGVNSSTAESELKGKPEIIKDLDSVEEGYAIGSKGYKLTGEVALWGYLPMIKEVEDIPPEEVIDRMINVHRNPVRKANFTVLVHKEFYLPGDKLFIGENEDIASVYVINSVTTKFTNESVIQELDIFSWQKTYEIQKLIMSESVKNIEEKGGIETIQAFEIQNNANILNRLVNNYDTGFVLSDKIWADFGAKNEMNQSNYDKLIESKLSELQKLATKINKK